MSNSIQPKYEIASTRSLIDPRSFTTKIWDSLDKPWIPLAWAAIAAVIILIWPGFIPFAVVIYFVFWLAVITKPDTLPIHLPLGAGKPDLNDPKPGDKAGFYTARGSFYVGKIRGLGLEVWMSFKALTQHWLIFGTTGAGKTESIVSYIVNYLAVGSGVAFQDAKAAPKAMIQLATFCRIFNRDCDFRVTNYITGLSASRRDPAERISNDAAVFAKGNAESNTQLLVSLMPPSAGDNKIFAERAVALVAAEMPALTDLRELGKLQIDPGVIRRFMSFKAFVSLFRDNHISKRSRDALQAYLESLPGYDEKIDISEQPEEVQRQFGFAQAYFTRSLASLSDTYGHIYLVGQGEIDYQDAVLNGRILLTLLPSMEKSGEELANLGKIVLTATKNGMVVGLGTVFEGSAEDIVHNLPTNSDIPYGVMNDENAYMLVEGQEMINAQARGLGFGVLTGTQDAPGMLLGIEKTTKQIMANSAVKQIMYLDDKDTTELAVEFSGEANVIVRNRYERHGDLGNVYASTDSSLEKRNRIAATDIKKQGLGQAFIMYQGKVHEVQVFNHGISEKGNDPLRRYLSHWYSVRLAKVKIPTEGEMEKLMKLSPRPEWDALLLMIRDDSRAMLSEMAIYFQSMLTINNMARSYQATPEMLDLTMSTYAAKSMLEDEIEEPSGLIAILRDHRPSTYKDSIETLAQVVKNSKSGQVAVARMGDEANLDAILAMQFDDDTPSDSSVATGSSGGGAGSLKVRIESELATPSDLLDDFLGEEPTTATPPTIEKRIEPEAEMAHEPREARPMTDVADAVAMTLPLMPWFASQVEYSQVRSTLVQAELLFNGGDIAQADESTDLEFQRIASTLDYPKTLLTQDEQTKQRVRDVLKGII